jgi:hypothetical protein
VLFGLFLGYFKISIAREWLANGAHHYFANLCPARVGMACQSSKIHKKIDNAAL